MNKAIILTLLTFYSLAANSQRYGQIITKEVYVVDTFYSDYIIEDKYRWLEDINSKETKAWIINQKRMSKSYLSRCSFKTNSLLAIDKYSTTKSYYPSKKTGNYYFKFFSRDITSAPALYYRSDWEDEWEKLVDPNKIFHKDKVRITDFSVSKDSKYLAYQFSRNGSDRAEVQVVSLKTGSNLDDHLKGLRFTNIVWLGDGFYYSTSQQDDQFGRLSGQEVYYHQIGQEQVDDKLIIDRNNPSIRFEYQTINDERFFVLKEINEEVNKYSIYFVDNHTDSKQVKVLMTNITHNLKVLGFVNEKFIALTTQDSNNGVIVEIDPEVPSQCQVIISEFSNALLVNAVPFPDRILAVFQIDQHPVITVFDYEGNILYNLELPVGTSAGLGKSKLEDEAFFYYQSFTIPPVVYYFNIYTFKKKLVRHTSIAFEVEDIVYEKVEYRSKDSVLVPMILVHKKEITLNGANPTVLKAYGGFGLISKPSFDPGIVHFVKNGGVFAFAYIRGGGEKGIDWASAGKGFNKQNSFDDFIAAAEFLIEKKYTNSDKLAITGTSNGGLVVAVALIQRPDLFNAAVVRVAPLDMIRFENFTMGKWHIDEYGTNEDSLGFINLYAYSPYHNIIEEINYPTILVVTSDHDDRVPPFNSYKFVAGLQSRSAQENPILLKVEKKAGHSGASTKLTSLKELSEIYGFLLHELTDK